MYQHIQIPAEGEKITVNADMSLNVPDQPIILFIEGDGTGVDITPVLECKHKAMACFVSQLAMQAYDRHVNALNVFRTYTLPASVLAAEGFRVCTPQEARDDPYGLMFQGHAHPALAAMRVTGGAMTFADWCRRGMRLLRRAC